MATKRYYSFSGDTTFRLKDVADRPKYLYDRATKEQKVVKAVPRPQSRMAKNNTSSATSEMHSITRSDTKKKLNKAFNKYRTETTK